LKTQRTTRYALYAAIEMAAAAAGEPVTAAAVAARHRLPPAVVAKVFQRLARAGIASGSRGVSGGYRLARPASRVTVLEVIAACEEVGGAAEAPPEAALPAAELRLRELFAEIDEQARATLASVTLETLVRPRRALSPAAAPRGAAP
jgi:Rrf2 family protein